MSGFVLGVAVGIVINIITALFSRKAAIKLIPWLCLYIALHGVFLLMHQHSINSFAMAEARKYPHWLSYLVVIFGAALLAWGYWYSLLQGVAWLDSKTVEQHKEQPTNPAPPTGTSEHKMGKPKGEKMGAPRPYWRYSIRR